MIDYRAGASAIAIALIFSTSAHAQAAPAAPTTAVAGAAETNNAAGVQDIIVTAQRRSESLQKTALTIQVFNSDAIAKAGVTSPAQLTSLIPGVQIGTSGPATSVYVRGVGGFQATAASSPAVPYYIDGVYVARTQSFISEFYDVDRVELVKGPQGTLYGRNASGGAINVLTRRPKLGKFEARGEVEVGNYSDKNGELAINVPVGDKFAIRASGTLVDKGGYTSTGFGSDKHVAGRVKALWQASSDVSLLLNASYGHIYGGQGGNVALNRNIPGWYPWLDASDPRSQAFVYSTAIAPFPIVRATNPGDAAQNLRFYNLSAQLDWKLGDATLTVIPAYRDAKFQYTGLFGFLLRNGYDLGSFLNQPLTSKASSLETRLSGDLGHLKYVLGLYYDNEDQTEQFTINGGFIEDIGQRTVLGTRSYAAFGQLNYAVTDKVRLIGGLRYTADRRTLAGQSYFVTPAVVQGPPPPQAAACLVGPPPTPAPTAPQCLVDFYTGKKTFKNVSFKAGFEADLFTNSLFYATVSRGFKAGGFNDQSGSNAPAIFPTASNPAGTPGGALPLQPETLTSYEAGLKSRFLNNRVQVNLSAYYWNYKNHQEPVLTYTNVPGVTNLVFLNAGVSRIYGGTIDVIARPWTGGTINATAEYAHSRYQSFTKQIPIFVPDSKSGCRVTGTDFITNPLQPTKTLDCAGFEVSRTPKWTGSIGLTQSVDLGSGKLIGNGTLTFASARWLGTDFVPQERVHAYGKLDVSLTYEAPARLWSLTGFVRNVTNATVYTEASLNPFSDLIYGNIQPPRSYGAILSFNY